MADDPKATDLAADRLAVGRVQVLLGEGEDQIVDGGPLPLPARGDDPRGGAKIHTERKPTQSNGIVPTHQESVNPTTYTNIPPNLDHPSRRGRKARGGREVPIWAKGRRVDAAQVPAHTQSAGSN